MVHFFGILSPKFGKGTAAEDAPNKRSFFSGLPDYSLGSIPMSRAEQDACFLAERWPEPAEDVSESSLSFVRFRSPARL